VNIGPLEGASCHTPKSLVLGKNEGVTLQSGVGGGGGGGGVVVGAAFYHKWERTAMCDPRRHARRK